MLAAMYDNFEILKLLIENGASIDCIDLNNKNALHYALMHSNYKLADYLMKGFPILMKKPRKCFNPDKEWKSPYETAIKYYRFWALDYMFDKYKAECLKLLSEKIYKNKALQLKWEAYLIYETYRPIYFLWRKK